jgi:predicted Zn-dependent protease
MLLGATLLAAAPAHATLERAQAAQARGDLRGAQLELRNAVRIRPNDPALRAALAEASLDLGDGDTAEKEARAALERGLDQAEGTRLLLRAYMTLDRMRDLLRDFPAREQPAPLGGQIAAARAVAQLSLDDRAAARQSAADAVRLAPGAAEPHLAVAAVALADGDAAAAEAAVDRALAAEPGNIVARMRKAAIQLGRREAAAAETLAPVVARAPGNVPARIVRAESFLQQNMDDAARAEVDAALRIQGGNLAAIYLRAVLLSRAGDWRGADEAFTRLGGNLGSFPDGFLAAATVKRATGQLSQAEDLARRHVARRPEDLRGAKLLAVLELEGGRPDAAAGTLARLAERGAGDAEAFDMLGRAQVSAGRRREAVAAFERAASLASEDAGILSRLAAARLAWATSPAPRARRKARSTWRPPKRGRGSCSRPRRWRAAISRRRRRSSRGSGPKLRGARRHRSWPAPVRLGRLDPAGARTAFEAALRINPNSTPGRLGLARAAAALDDGATAERLLAEVLARAPDNTRRSRASWRSVLRAARGQPRRRRYSKRRRRPRPPRPGSPRRSQR